MFLFTPFYGNVLYPFLLAWRKLSIMCLSALQLVEWSLEPELERSRIRILHFYAGAERSRSEIKKKLGRGASRPKFTQGAALKRNGTSLS